MRQGIPFIVSGPSGGGKTTLANSVLDKFDNLRFSVSCTTRKPRAGEVDGQDYIFISEADFAEKAAQGGFVEHALVHGNYYGTPVDQFESARETGVDLLLDIDVQGAAQIRQNYPEAVFCFVLPPNLKVLERRLVERNSNKDKDIGKRLLRAKEEMAPEILEQYDYIIVNDDLESALESLFSIIVSTRCESKRVLEKVKSNLLAQ